MTPVNIPAGQWPGLTERLAANGIALEFIDGVPHASNAAAGQAIIDAYTPADALASIRAEVTASITAHAKALRDRVVGSYSAGELASWPIKLAEAAKYAQTGQAGDAPMLAAEAQARGITMAELVGKVGGNAATFAALEAAIAGIDGKHRDAIKALATVAQVAAYDWRTGWPEV